MKLLALCAPILALTTFNFGAFAESEKLDEPLPQGPVAFSDLPAAGKQSEGFAEAYAKLLARRTQRLNDFDIYIEAGQYSKNTEFPGVLMPVFVDEDGVACAVAHLMRKAGEEKLVEQVREENNNVRLWDLTDGPVLEWILRSGLTREECELIQEPGFGREPISIPEPLPEKPVMDPATMMKQEHFRLVLRKLRKDTPASLMVALKRVKGEGRFSIFEKADDQAAALFTNTFSGSMLVRLTKLNADGSVAQTDTWRTMSMGKIASLAEMNQAGPCIVEYRAQNAVDAAR